MPALSRSADLGQRVILAGAANGGFSEDALQQEATRSISGMGRLTLAFVRLLPAICIKHHPEEGRRFVGVLALTGPGERKGS